jgi:hypothetical protein
LPDKVSVFISYAREDSATAQRLFSELRQSGADPWLDTERLLAGERWKVAIKRAIRQSRYFLAVLSSKAVTKRGVVQSELKQALEILDELPESDIFLIPVRVDECSPSHDKLKDLNWVDLFPSFDKGVEQIKKVIFPLEESQSSSSVVFSPDFYVYVSDAKLAMLSSQIPEGIIAKLAGELNISQTVVRDVSVEPMKPGTRYGLAKIVGRYLADQGQVGTVDSPNTYFEGTLSMKWGPYRTMKWDEPSPLVYFGGESEKTILGLGGSAHHVIGAVGSSSAHSHSVTPYLVSRLYEGIELPLPKEEEKVLRQYEGHDKGQDRIAMAVDLATRQMIGTEQKLRFLARRLAFYPKQTHSGWSTDMNILLGTPLYVCLNDNP